MVIPRTHVSILRQAQDEMVGTRPNAEAAEDVEEEQATDPTHAR
jgi:hypothetical protein